MHLPDGYAARPPTLDDGPAIVEMMNEETMALIGVPVASLGWITAPWGAVEAKLDADFAVIVAAEGEIAGYLSLISEPPHTIVFSAGCVALAHHGRGLGGAIVRDVERRAQRFVAMAPSGEPVVLHVGTLSDEPHVSALLLAHGYVEVRRLWAMQLRFAGPEREPDAIAGVEIRRFRQGDEFEAYDCLAEAFLDHWGSPLESRAQWLRQVVHGDNFDPGLWRLAWQGTRLVGVLIGEPEASQDPELGCVALLGVRAEARRRGVAEALLRSIFVELQHRGQKGAMLLVDSQSLTGATRLYERVGMRATPRFATWEKRIG
jgi:mycothiol synthase